MSKEEHEYHANVRAVVIVGMGVAGSFLGFFLPVTGMSTFGLDVIYVAAILGILCGFFLGAVCGVLLSWTMSVTPSDASGRSSRGPQLVGRSDIGGSVGRVREAGATSHERSRVSHRLADRLESRLAAAASRPRAIGATCRQRD